MTFSPGSTDSEWIVNGKTMDYANLDCSGVPGWVGRFIALTSPSTLCPALRCPALASPPLIALTRSVLVVCTHHLCYYFYASYLLSHPSPLLPRSPSPPTPPLLLLSS